MMYKVGLVLEGGGMRGMFTTGVLDFFLEKDLEFEEIVGVSAGVIHAASFLSKQKYRSRDIALTFINDKRYFSVNSLIKTGDIFNVKFAYYEIPDKYFPFDYKAFKKNKSLLVAVATDIAKGKPKYFNIKNFDSDEVELLRASASLPMISKDVIYHGKKYLDGGLTDSIPIRKIEKDGYKKNVVILTQPLGYKKRKSKSYLLMKKRYKKYPHLIKTIKNRYKNYNETIDYLREQEEEGKVFIIRPKKEVKIKRLEKKVSKLELAYQHGYDTAKHIYSDLIKFLENN